MVRCPLHEDRSPSLSINLSNGLWLCFSCGNKGGLQRLAALVDKDIDRVELAHSQVERLLREPEPKVDMGRLAQSQRAGTEPDWFWDEYAKPRGLGGEWFDHFQIGHHVAWDAMAMPYFDGKRVAGIKYRFRDGRKGSEKGSHRTIYNVNEVRGSGHVALFEGESDTHRAWQVLHETSDAMKVGGIGGAQASHEQWESWALDLMYASRVYVVFDADDAGDKGAEKALEVLGSKAVRARPTKGKDFSDHLNAGGTLFELLKGGDS